MGYEIQLKKSHLCVKKHPRHRGAKSKMGAGAGACVSGGPGNFEDCQREFKFLMEFAYATSQYLIFNIIQKQRHAGASHAPNKINDF